jgi:hypothetical protein
MPNDPLPRQFIAPTEQDWLDHMAEELGAQKEGFQVKDTGGADWCIAMKAKALDRIKETKREYSNFVEPHQRWIERYASWLDAEIKRHEATIERMEILLRPYFDELKAAGKLPHDRKSVNLPSGTIGEQWHEVQWEQNDDELMPWAKPRGLVRTKEEVAWDAIKKQLRLSKDGLRAVIVHEVVDPNTGEVTQVEEVVPGVRVKSMPGDRFYVSPADHHKEDPTNGA